MTVVVAWVRHIQGIEELVFVSDSRLSGDGRTFDCSKKIIELPRGDCAIAFAGYTGDAFALMLQLANAIEAYEPAKQRAHDVTRIKRRALDVFNTMTEDIQAPNGIVRLSDALFLFGGYSWIKNRFELWSIELDESNERYHAPRCDQLFFSTESNMFTINNYNRSIEKKGAACTIGFIGDQADLAKQNLLASLADRHPDGEGYKGLDMQPFEVIRDMLRDEDREPSIGGAPQIVKVHRYMQTSSHCVYWPVKENGKIYLNGRVCQLDEGNEKKVLDPDQPS